MRKPRLSPGRSNLKAALQGATLADFKTSKEMEDANNFLELLNTNDASEKASKPARRSSGKKEKATADTVAE
jgi:hypothetical protein